MTGVVQGVGFRPFVHRIASELGLAGFVGNDSGAVFLEVQGRARAGGRIRAPAARRSPAAGADQHASPLPTWPPTRPAAASSGSWPARPSPVSTTPIPPDIAVCDECVAELFDPHDRRYRHPFVTCTNCGPRFTIIRGLPYDRPATTMSAFAMCERCAAEYHDPADRRFHAQPIACPDCGPSLWFSSAAGTGRPDRMRHWRPPSGRWQRGAVVAIKGIGGYHLACVVDDEAVVAGTARTKGAGRQAFRHAGPRPRRRAPLCLHRRHRGRGAVESGPADRVAAAAPRMRRSPTPSRPAARCWG